MLLRVRPSFQVHVTETSTARQLPRDGAPNKSLLKSVVAINTLRAAMLRRTIFVRKALLRAESSTVRKIISTCDNPTGRCWMKAMPGTYPVNSFLYRIRKISSPNCTHCNCGSQETLTHFLKVCRKFHHARTAAHNRVRQALFNSMKQHLAREWRIFEETSISKTGVRLQPVPTEIIRQRIDLSPTLTCKQEAHVIHAGSLT